MLTSQHPRVLVIDDDPRVRRALATLIESDGLPVVTAADASGAGEALHDVASGVELAIIDVRLPEARDGLDLISELAAHIPVIATSVTSAVRPAALAAGATAFTDKDGDADRLVTLVQTVTSRQ